MPVNRPGWGGRRAGAGRPRTPPIILPDLPHESDPGRWLLNLMRHAGAPMRLRIEAARALLRYRFAPSAPPERPRIAKMGLQRGYMEKNWRK